MAERNKSDDYDPHDHRPADQEHTMSNWDAIVNFLKGSLGTGILAMPSVFSFAGYGTGLILMFLIPITAIYGLHIMISSIYSVCKREQVHRLTYGEAMTLACESGPKCFRFGSSKAKYVVDFFLGLYPFGACAVYIVFIAENMKQIVDHYAVEFDLRLHMCILFLPLMMLFYIRDFRCLTPFSKIANALIFVGFVIIMYYLFTDIPHISERVAFKSAGNIPLFFGTAMFALESVGVIIEIEENMKTPKDFLGWLGVMPISMVVVSLMTGFIGFMGYWRYGDDVLGSITLNIPEHDVLAQVVKIMFAVAILFTYPLQGFITADVAWRQYLMKYTPEEMHISVQYVIRTVFVLLTLTFAILLPNLSMFASLCGAFTISCLGFIFPAIMHICVNYPDGYGKCKIWLVVDVSMIVIGICGGAIGTYTSIAGTVKEYN